MGLLVIWMITLVLQGCYLEPVSNYDYYSNRDAENERIQLFEHYFDTDEVYFDSNIHDENSIDWYQFLEQDDSFKEFKDVFFDYLFLTDIQDYNFDCSSELTSLTFRYNDQSHGYNLSISVRCINQVENYDHSYMAEATLTFAGKDLIVETKDKDVIKVTYDNEIKTVTVDERVSLEFNELSFTITPVPLGYELSINNNTHFIYDNNVIN